MSVEDGRRPARPEPWDKTREPKNNLERLIASAPAAPCTCPSGDASLRWPCPTHPNANYSAVRRTTFVQATSSPDFIRPDAGNRRFWAVDLADTPTAADAATELPHYDDIAIDHFTRVMKLKMETSRAIGRSGWDDPKQCSIESLQAMLLNHVAKGDPVDVANFCMMLLIRGGQTMIKKGGA